LKGIERKINVIMACSYCRENGHTKRNCPKEKDEKIKIQRDRLNMVIQVLPAIVENPIMQSMVWWQISKRVPLFDFFNKVVVGTETFAVAIGGSLWDIERVNLPQGVVMGAFLQETEDAVEFGSWVKAKIEEQIAERITSRLPDDPKEFVEETGGKVYDHLIGDFIDWLSGGVKTYDIR